MDGRGQFWLETRPHNELCTSRGIGEMAGNRPADSAFPPRGWEETGKARDEVFSKRAKRPSRGSELARDEGGARDPWPYPLRKRKQEALESENRRSNASDPPYRHDRGGEGETGDGDASMLGDGPTASLPDTEKKGDFILSGSERLWQRGAGRRGLKPPAC